MLKIVVFRCLLKNFKSHKCLKYVNYSTGSGNDENDNDKSPPKSKINETDTTITNINSNGLVSLFNDLLVKRISSQQNKLSRKKTFNMSKKTHEMNKFVFTNKESRKEITDSDLIVLKEILMKYLQGNEEFPKLTNDKTKIAYSDSRKLKTKETNSDLTHLKQIMSKSIEKNVESTMSKDDIKQIMSKSIEKNVKSTMSKDDIKKEQTDLRLTKFKELLTKSVSNVDNKDGADRLNFDIENLNKNTTSDLNDEKSPNSRSAENFKNLLSLCNLEVVNKSVDIKEFLENEISVSDYLKSILEIDLGFKDYQMEDSKKPFIVGKSDTNEDFIKLMNEIVIGDKVKVSAKYDSSEKSFISMNDPTMRLNIFTKIDSKIQTEKEKTPSIIDLMESYEYRKLNSNLPSSYFHECIQLTRDKIMRTFPIDNDQDSEELNVGFHEHVFPQQYLTGKLSNTGVIGQYMNYVCVGLSQNPHLTIEQKKAHIKWYEEYLSNKQEEIELATKKSIDELEYEKSLRNK